MKKIKFFLFTITLFFSMTIFAVEVTYISGVKYNLSMNDFQNVGENRYTAIVDISGDDGQPIIFDVDADVEGEGYIASSVISPVCIQWGQDGSCLQYEDFYIIDFRYQIDAKITCSGLPVGSSMSNKNEIIENKTGQINDKRRSIALNIGQTHSFGGECRQLQIEIEGDVGEIEKINMQILLVSEF